MTSPPENISVRCPKCGTVYEDWWRASINRSLEPDIDDAYVEEATTSTCPQCGFKVRHGALIVREDGVFEFDE